MPPRAIYTPCHTVATPLRFPWKPYGEMEHSLRTHRLHTPSEPRSPRSLRLRGTFGRHWDARSVRENVLAPHSTQDHDQLTAMGEKLLNPPRPRGTAGCERRGTKEKAGLSFMPACRASIISRTTASPSRSATRLVTVKARLDVTPTCRS